MEKKNFDLPLQFISQKELVKLLGISIRTFNRHNYQRHFKQYFIGGRIRYELNNCLKVINTKLCIK